MKLLWIFLISVLSLTATAQTAPKCEDSFKVFEGKYLVREFDEAYTLLADLRKRCPKVSENLYGYGEVILKYRIDVATLPEEKKPAVDDLIALYNEQVINYPASGADVKKIQLQLDHKLITDAEAYKAFDKTFARNKENFIDYNSLLAYFNLFSAEYKAGKGISDDQYFEKYGEITSQVLNAQSKLTKAREALLKKQETHQLTDDEKQFVADSEINIEGLKNVDEIIVAQSREYISCDKLNAYYDKNYEAHKADYAWTEAMVNALYGKKCYKSLMLQKGALALDAMKPSKETAFRLGMIALKKGDTNGGVKYFEQAAALENDQVKRSYVYFEIARSLKNSDKATAKKYILKTTELNPKNGEPYLLLAEMYAGVTSKGDCKITDFERKALNFLAIDAAKKAEADAKYKTAASAAITRYRKNLPTKDEAKVLKKKKGDVISYGCWINETLTLPNL